MIVSLEMIIGRHRTSECVIKSHLYIANKNTLIYIQIIHFYLNIKIQLDVELEIHQFTFNASIK